MLYLGDSTVDFLPSNGENAPNTTSSGLDAISRDLYAPLTTLHPAPWRVNNHSDQWAVSWALLRWAENPGHAHVWFEAHSNSTTALNVTSTHCPRESSTTCERLLGAAERIASPFKVRLLAPIFRTPQCKTYGCAFITQCFIVGVSLYRLNGSHLPRNHNLLIPFVFQTNGNGDFCSVMNKTRLGTDDLERELLGNISHNRAISMVNEAIILPRRRWRRVPLLA